MKNTKLLLSLCLCISGATLWGQNQHRVSLMFTGDIMQHESQLNAAKQPDGTYSFDECFKYVQEDIQSVDFAIGNLEVPLAGKPYSGYPQFSAPDALGVALKNAGFDILCLSNNHAVDRYKKGLNRTIDVLDSLGIDHTGVFKDTLSREKTYPFFFEKNGIKFALLNYTYDTNGIVPTSPNYVNTIDKVQMKKDIDKAKEGKPDIIIVYIHWGVEYQLNQHKIQEDYTKFMFDNGVHIVAGGHPHVVQPMEKRYDKDGNITNIVMYSHGNYISGQRTINTQGGVVTKVTFYRDEKGVTIEECNYNLVWVWKPIQNGKQKFFLLPVSQAEHKDFPLSEEDYNRMNTFAKTARDLFNKYNINISEYKY